MRINILTQPLFVNYGGILQNYALQTILRRLGHKPLTINIPTSDARHGVLWKEWIKTLINAVKRSEGLYSSPYLNPFKNSVKERELSFPQREFIDKHIDKADEVAPFKKDLCERHPADAWIVGSDQVWRPWCSPYIENCFLDFVPRNIIKVAYAVSFGVDHWEIPSYKTETLKDLAADFKMISVREKSGVKLCKDKLKVAATHVLDPTMLLSADDYLQLTTNEEHSENPYIASYILDIDKHKRNIIKRLSKQYGLNVEEIGVMHRDGFDTVEKWISSIAHSERVVTDSFHGTVFSVIFNRPVMFIGNDLRGNTRLESLIDALNLKKGSDGFYRDGENTRERLKNFKKISLDFLNQALS